METPIQKILELLVQSPGNIIYHLVLVFSVLSSLQAAIIGRQSNPYPHMQRLVFGLGMLLVGQAVLFFSSGFAWQEILDWDLFLPLLDRAVLVFGLVWVVWLWNFPAPARLGDLVTGLLLLGIVILFLFTYSLWSVDTSGQPFNQSSMDLFWNIAALFVVLSGMVILLFSRPPGWGFGFGMLSLMLAGFATHMLLMPAEGGLSGFIRLGQLAAYPLLPTLLYRFSAETAPVIEQVKEQKEAAPAPAVQETPPGVYPRTQERRRYSAGPRTVHSWLELREVNEPEKIIAKMAKALAQTMLSDLCFIVSGPSYGHVVLQSGYDLIREEELPGTMLEQSTLPVLATALQRGKAVRVCETDAQPADLKALSAALGIDETGSIMFVPISAEEKPQGGLLFLSPYSNRQWSAEDQNYLSAELELIALILRRAQQQAESAGSAERVGDDLRAELESLRLENQKMLQEINQLRSAAAAKPPVVAPNMELSALVALQEESMEQIATLQAENERLQAALRDKGISVYSPDEMEQMEAELRATLQELAQLQNQLAEANARILILEREARAPSGNGSDNSDVVISVVQEIRQPMSSILGYTDLLLTESVGILGALQRKFLERIKASTERMHTMLNELIQVTALGSGTVDVMPKAVNLSALIDEAVLDTSAQLREKNIALHVDLPQSLPEIYADQDAIQQVILQLLQNAGAVSPQEGSVTLRARLKKDEDQKEYLLLQVTDMGGGIQPEDLPRVFNRRYRADLPLIQGLGDTGVGLSIAKTLVEAHGGRIWVESAPGETTTFSVLLPVRQNDNPTGQE